jgi:hypothetical protein
MGGIADAAFGAYNAMVHLALTVAGAVVFGFMFIAMGHGVRAALRPPDERPAGRSLPADLLPARAGRLLDRLDAHGPRSASVYGLMEFMLLSFALVPSGSRSCAEGPFRWFVSLIASGSTVILLRRVRQGPGAICRDHPPHRSRPIRCWPPSPSSSGNMLSLMVGKVGEQVEFGGHVAQGVRRRLAQDPAPASLIH